MGLYPCGLVCCGSCAFMPYHCLLPYNGLCVVARSAGLLNEIATPLSMKTSRGISCVEGCIKGCCNISKCLRSRRIDTYPGTIQREDSIACSLINCHGTRIKVAANRGSLPAIPASIDEF